MPRLTLGHALDPSTLADTGQPATLDVDALTRHAVCVGMTGSGKTGLCIGMLEALSACRIPIVALDPKGDLANLALVFEGLTGEAFAAWVDPAEAVRREISVASLAAETAARWDAALLGEGIDAGRRARWRSRVEVVVHTPGSESGVPIDVFTGLTRPPPGLADDPEGLREYVTGAVSALLGLMGHPPVGLQDPRAILLSRILGDAFAAGERVPLDVLVPRIVDPPFASLGYFAVDQVLPRDDRRRLALELNNIAASPAFQAWHQGVPLNVAAWLAPTADGRTPLRVLSLAHLDDRQRQFFVTLVLHAVVAWSRRQAGTGALRALLFFDEVMGFLPPHPKDPPSKSPLMTLLKQARSVGLGVVLSTQNPVDVDYKAMANAATWWVGRLQTRQDRARVVEGLVAAVGEAEGTAVAEMLGRLPRRTFAWRTADEPGARLMRSRHTMSWLRGPMTRREIARLGQRWERADPGDGLLGEPPTFPPEVPVRWLLPEGCAALELTATGAWEATLYARLRLVFDEPGFWAERVVHRWWRGGEVWAVELADGWLGKRAPPKSGRYRPVDAAIGDPVAIGRMRRAWEEEVRANEVVEREGRRVWAERADVEVMGWAVVWVPA